MSEGNETQTPGASGPPTQQRPGQARPQQTATPKSKPPAQRKAIPKETTTDPAPVSSGRPMTREQRRPFGSQRQKLAYPIRPGFHRHWFNETPGRLQEAEMAGYKYVLDKEGLKVCRPVGVTDAGGALMAYLMEIPEEWFNEDMSAQQARVDEVDKAIRRGDVEGKVGEEGRYVPRTGIKISDKRS